MKSSVQSNQQRLETGQTTLLALAVVCVVLLWAAQQLFNPLSRFAFAQRHWLTYVTAAGWVSAFLSVILVVFGVLLVRSYRAMEGEHAFRDQIFAVCIAVLLGINCLLNLVSFFSISFSNFSLYNYFHISLIMAVFSYLFPLWLVLFAWTLFSRTTRLWRWIFLCSSVLYCFACLLRLPFDPSFWRNVTLAPLYKVATNVRLFLEPLSYICAVFAFAASSKSRIGKNLSDGNTNIA